jgi:glucokinase
MTAGLPGRGQVDRPGAVLAVDFGGTKAAVAVFDTAGALLARSVLAMCPEHGAAQAVERALEASLRLLAAPPVRGLTLRAAGVASPGIVLADRVLLAPNVPGWSELRLAERFTARLGVPVRCENDVKAATLAEATWGHLAGVDPGMHWNLGTGLAVGLVLSGRVLSGAHGAAGELGYALRTPEDPCGPHRGLAPLEQRAGGRALGELGLAFGGSGDARSFLDLARDPASPARRRAREVLGELAVQVVNSALLLDPVRITLGGGLTGAADLLVPVLRDLLDRATPFPPELRVARFAMDGPLVGAAALALHGVGAGGPGVDLAELRGRVHAFDLGA